MTDVLERDRDDEVVRELLAPLAHVEPVAFSPRADARTRRRPGARMLAAAVVSVPALLAAAAFVFDWGMHHFGPSASPAQQAFPPRSRSVLTSGTIELASYRFRLPAGFKASRRLCASTSSTLTPAIPKASSNPFAAAASADGGCIEVVLVAGSDSVPDTAEPVNVGPYHGFLASDTPSQHTLYVTVPVATGQRYLVLLARGLSSEQLLAIAESGLPSSIPPTQPCSANCG